MIYGFNSEDVAFALKGVGEERLAGFGKDPAPTGKEVIFVKTPEDGIPARPPQPDPDDPDAEDPEAMEAVECKRVYIDEDLMLQESDDQVLDVINTSTTDIPGEIYVKVVMLGIHWVAVPDSGPTIRVKFVTIPDAADPFMDSEYNTAVMAANVLDPLNSGLEVGEEILIYDPYKEFMFTPRGAGGIAVRGDIETLDPEGEPGDTYRRKEWIIEQCDQAVVRVKGSIAEPLAPWVNTSSTGSEMPVVSNITSESYWPYIIWLEGEDSEIATNVTNPHRFTANPGFVWMERREVHADAHQVVSGPMTYPEDGQDPTWEWVIVDVEKPTARWSECMKGNDKEWLMNGGDFWEGSNPSDNSLIEGVTVPGVFADNPTWCAVPAGTPGVAFLDDNTGWYVVTSTMSALYGSGTLSEVIGQEMSDSPGTSTPLLYDDPEECNKLNYKKWKNVVVFGNPAGGDCVLEHETPDPYVELGGQYEKDVVTGIQVNAQGDLEFTTTTVKVCDPQDGIKDAPNTEITYLTNVGCEGEEFKQQYKSFNIIGSPITDGSQPVDASCISNQFDYEYIFDNYVFNQDWWNISYYDITYPEGCEPCPTGCCTYEEDGETKYKSGISREECEDSGNYPDGTWSEEPCPETPCGCCKTVDGTGFETYQEGLTEAECQALITSPPTGSGADIVSAECIEECPGEPTGCCWVSEGDYRPDMTQVACVTGLGGTWSEGEDCPEVGCCTLNYTAGGTEDIITTQALCDSYDGGIFEGQDVDTTNYAGDGTTCSGGDCSDDCCCALISDVFVQVNCPPNPMQPGGSGSPVWMFEQDVDSVGDGSCTWVVQGTWRDDLGTETSGTVTITANGSQFTMTGTTPDGDSLNGTHNGQVTTSACSSIGQWYFNHDNEPACT